MLTVQSPNPNLKSQNGAGYVNYVTLPPPDKPAAQPCSVSPDCRSEYDLTLLLRFFCLCYKTINFCSTSAMYKKVNVQPWAAFFGVCLSNHPNEWKSSKLMYGEALFLCTFCDSYFAVCLSLCSGEKSSTANKQTSKQTNRIPESSYWNLIPTPWTNVWIVEYLCPALP